MDTPPDIDAIRAAHARIAAHVHRTPVLRSRTLDDRTGATVVLKCEHLQRGGAFKARGAMNAVLSASDAELVGGVATHSSGNHGAALALAAAVRGVPAHIVMPRTVPAVKEAAVRGYGAAVVHCGPTLAEREQGLREIVARTGALPVHPYDDWRVIAGQGTAALELLEQEPELDTVLVPLGGGGLLAGTAIAASGRARVVGVEPAGADDGFRGFTTGVRVTGTSPATIADGLRAEVGVRNFDVIRERVDEILTVTDDEIVAAMRFAFERLKQVVEPSAATVLAALLGRRLRGDRIGAILTGGNCDLDALPWRAG